METFDAAVPEPVPPGEPLRVPLAEIEDSFGKKLLYVARDGSTQEVVVARVHGELRAADTYCPHEGGRIADGPLMDETYFHCPLHLYRFDSTTGEADGVPCPPLATARVTVEGDQALVWVHELPLEHEPQ